MPGPPPPEAAAEAEAAARKVAYLAALKEQKRRAARENLLDFIEYCMPHKDFPDDVRRSRYFAVAHHKLLINLFTRVSLGMELRAGVSIPPQHGKSTVFAQYGIAWHCARNPEQKIIYGTFSEPRAGIVGAAVRNLMKSDRFREVFPEFTLRKGEDSKTLIGFGEEGSVMFVGRGSGASGNPCDLFIIDDPYKSRGEARSAQIRGIVWDWYCSVVEARCPATTPIAIIHTRWNDDDLLGRLCDHDHPDYDPDENDEFDYLNIPAIIECPEMAEKLGMDPAALPAALWPEDQGKPKWPLELLQRIRKKNPASFSAVFMGRPVPPDGDFFTKKMIRSYRRHELPENLRSYGASDHAVSTLVRNDHSVIGCAGLDYHGNLYVYPDLVWRKIETPQQVEEIIRLVRKYRPINWWAEGDHIKKAIGPFLRLRLKAERLYCTIFKELPKAGDKQQKAQPIRGMAEMGMVFLPVDTPWYQDAVAQLLRFDGSEGRPDDFVDFLANLGRGIDKMQPGTGPAPPEEKLPATGTAAWVKMAGSLERRSRAMKKALEGW